MPAEPLVGAVTTWPPPAFSSLTDMANNATHAESEDSSAEEMRRSRLSTSLLAARRRYIIGRGGHVQTSRQRRRRAGAPGVDTVAHHVPDSREPVTHLLRRAPGRFVRPDDVGDAQMVLPTGRSGHRMIRRGMARRRRIRPSRRSRSPSVAATTPASARGSRSARRRSVRGG